MIMLKKLQPKEIENIRQCFTSHILYDAIKEACCDCCALTQTYCLRQEHVFVEVISYLDDLKENQQNIKWHHLYKDIYQDYRYQNSQIPSEELHAITSTIICTLASVLTISFPYYYHSLAEKLLQQVFAHNHNVPREQLFALMDTMEQRDKDISQWLNDYMQSDEFISDEMKEFLLPLEMQIKGTPQHITFTEHATIGMRDEFNSVLLRVINDPKNYGKAGRTKTLLKKYENDGIIQFLGTETDIYRDLVSCYDYKQDDSTFFAASPTLSKTRQKN